MRPAEGRYPQQFIESTGSVAAFEVVLEKICRSIIEFEASLRETCESIKGNDTFDRDV